MSEPTDRLAHREHVPKMEMQPHFPRESESSVYLNCDLSDLNTLIGHKKGTAERFRQLEARPLLGHGLAGETLHQSRSPSPSPDQRKDTPQFEWRSIPTRVKPRSHLMS